MTVHRCMVAQQYLNNVAMAMGRGQHQGSITLTIGVVERRTTLYAGLHRRDIARRCREEKGRLPATGDHNAHTKTDQQACRYSHPHRRSASVIKAQNRRNVGCWWFRNPQLFSTTLPFIEETDTVRPSAGSVTIATCPVSLTLSPRLSMIAATSPG